MFAGFQDELCTQLGPCVGLSQRPGWLKSSCIPGSLYVPWQAVCSALVCHAIWLWCCSGSYCSYSVLRWWENSHHSLCWGLDKELVVSELFTALIPWSLASFPTALCLCFSNHYMERIMFNLPHRAVVRADVWKLLSKSWLLLIGFYPSFAKGLQQFPWRDENKKGEMSCGQEVGAWNKWYKGGIRAELKVVIWEAGALVPCWYSAGRGRSQASILLCSEVLGEDEKGPYWVFKLVKDWCRKGGNNVFSSSFVGRTRLILKQERLDIRKHISEH